ncbi:hypothetical protein J6590_059853 [Homalodisca vitripennis]|nr:hypothetical protein J6590_059853 [Homalodisca vitripennis]
MEKKTMFSLFVWHPKLSIDGSYSRYDTLLPGLNHIPVWYTVTGTVCGHRYGIRSPVWYTVTGIILYTVTGMLYGYRYGIRTPNQEGPSTVTLLPLPKGFQVDVGTH